MPFISSIRYAVWPVDFAYCLGTQYFGPTRFGALKRQLEGVSSKVLTDRLRMLEKQGLIYRDYNPTIPPEVILNRIENWTFKIYDKVIYF